jgi:hypothetical protein
LSFGGVDWVRVRSWPQERTDLPCEAASRDRRRRVFAAVLASGALIFPSSALAALCHSYSSESLPVWHWVISPPSFTDESRWGAGLYAYDASRFTEDNIATLSQHMPNGGYTAFDNGTYSPWRKTGILNNATPQGGGYSQWNNNGSCF